jgi:hypothetical protein
LAAAITAASSASESESMVDASASLRRLPAFLGLESARLHSSETQFFDKCPSLKNADTEWWILEESTTPNQ